MPTNPEYDDIEFPELQSVSWGYHFERQSACR